jgi:hypothetical protein
MSTGVATLGGYLIDISANSSVNVIDLELNSEIKRWKKDNRADISILDLVDTHFPYEYRRVDLDGIPGIQKIRFQEALTTETRISEETEQDTLRKLKRDFREFAKSVLLKKRDTWDLLGVLEVLDKSEFLSEITRTERLNTFFSQLISENIKDNSIISRTARRVSRSRSLSRNRVLRKHVSRSRSRSPSRSVLKRQPPTLELLIEETIQQGRSSRPQMALDELQKTQPTGNLLALAQSLQIALLCGGILTENEVRELIGKIYDSLSSPS